MALSEIDIDAIISYAAIHINNFENIDFDYPSDDEMRDWLIKRNIGYDFTKKKSKVARLKESKLKQVYKASVLLNNLGDISSLNPSDLPDFDLFNFSFPCFVAGTLVLTDKGYKKIEEITSDDLVLTHTNQYQKVVKPMTNYTDCIYRLKTMCSEDLLAEVLSADLSLQPINNEVDINTDNSKLKYFLIFKIKYPHKIIIG